MTDHPKHGSCECGEALEHFTGPNAGGILCPVCDEEHADELRTLNAIERREPETNDARFTAGLMFDVIEVMKKHGYQKHSDALANADVLVSLLGLVRAFEGIGLVSSR